MAVVNSSRFNLKEGVSWAVQKWMENYNADVIEVMSEVIPEVAKESVKKLKQTSPKGSTGKYAKGWAYQLDKGRLRVGATVYGKNGTYQLAHLLEFGHVTRNGTGRVFDKTGAKEHIAPVEQWANDELIDRTIERLESL